MSMFAAIVHRELLLTWRDRAGLALLVVVPAVVMTIAGFALRPVFDGRRAVPAVTIVDADRRPTSRMLVARLARSGALRVTVLPAPAPHDAGGTVLTVPPGFSAALERGDTPRLVMTTDPARPYEGEIIGAVIREIAWRLAAVQIAARVAGLQILAATGDVDPAAIRRDLMSTLDSSDIQSVAVETQAASGMPARLRSFDVQVPGLSIMFLLLGALGGVGRRVLEDEHAGRVRRFVVAPGGPMRMLAGVLAARAGVGAAQMVALLAFGHLAFGLPLGTSPLALATLTLAIVFAAVSFGALLGSIARTEEQLTMIGVATILAMAALGGCWWPLFIEPEWMQRLANLTLTKWSMTALTHVLLQDASVRDIRDALGVLTAFGAGALALAFVGFRRRWAEGVP
jgi:ABC-2 type transport system permease protein